MLQLCFCMTTMSKSRTSLLIKNDFWIFNDFLMLYCSIHRKDCFIIKLFVAVVDSAKRRLFECFQSSWVYLVFWFVISDSAWATSHLSRYSYKKNDQHVSSWLLSSVMLIHEQLDCMFSAQLLLSLMNLLNWESSWTLKSSLNSKSSLNLKSSLKLQSLKTAKSLKIVRMCNCIWALLNIWMICFYRFWMLVSFAVVIWNRCIFKVHDFCCS